MQSFNDFFKAGKTPTSKPRHMKAFDYQPINRKSTDFVPKSHQVKHDNVKYLNVKDGRSRFEILLPKDMSELRKKFGFKSHIDKIVKLGNTGLRLQRRGNRFILFR